MVIQYNLDGALLNEIERLEKEFLNTRDEGERRRIFYEIETTYRELDNLRTRGG